MLPVPGYFQVFMFAHQRGYSCEEIHTVIYLAITAVTLSWFQSLGSFGHYMFVCRCLSVYINFSYPYTYFCMYVCLMVERERERERERESPLCISVCV